MRSLFALSLCVPLAAAAACSKLTEPPATDPIAADTPVASAATSATARATATASQAPTPSATAPAADVQVAITDSVVGKGAEVKIGDTITVHYTGTLKDGTKFDSSRDRGEPATFRLMPHQLIDGWVKGLPGMKVGGKRKLVIPWQLAYGERGSPPKIPPRSDLVFDIELISIGQPTQAPPIQPQH